MKLVDVMNALGQALGVIEGLRVKPYTERRVTPPQALVTLPRRYSYDATMGRGSDDMELRVMVYVGQVDAESARNAIGQYVDGVGGLSVKEAIESFTTTAYDIAHVLDVDFPVATVAGVEYQTAAFRVRVVGKG